jgi:hypothetical protein
MTEAEWLACEDAEDLLKNIPDDLSLRKLRLLGVACCRLEFPQITDKQCLRAVIAAESTQMILRVKKRLRLPAERSVGSEELGSEQTYISIDISFQAFATGLRRLQRRAFFKRRFIYSGIQPLSRSNYALSVASSATLSALSPSSPSGLPPPSSRWRGRCTRREISARCRFWPMPSRTQTVGMRRS